MKILLIAVGTRGDVEPFLAIAEILDKNGHEIICCFPEQFRQITEDSNFKFSGLTPTFLEMLKSKEGIIAMGGKANLFQKINAYYTLFRKANKIHKLISCEQHALIQSEKPDKIIYHLKANYPLIYETTHPGKTILVSPIPYIVHSRKDHAHLGFKNTGTFFNKLSYKIAKFGLLRTVLSATEGLPGTKNLGSKEIKDALSKGKMIYTISPFLFKASPRWSNNVKILGYHERNKTLNWKPEKTLSSFIQKHEEILFVTFGSMVNGEPKEKTEMILKVLKELKIPAIINTSEGGLVKLPNGELENVYFVNNIPYDWLLPKVTFMVHHGGSGTTHMAMKYACPSIIIPHIIDQFLWNDLNYEKGLGPKGMSINKLNEGNFKVLLKDLISNTSYKQKAIQASEEIKNEDYESALYNFILS